MPGIMSVNKISFFLKGQVNNTMLIELLEHYISPARLSQLNKYVKNKQTQGHCVCVCI